MITTGNTTNSDAVPSNLDRQVTLDQAFRIVQRLMIAADDNDDQKAFSQLMLVRKALEPHLDRHRIHKAMIKTLEASGCLSGEALAQQAIGVIYTFEMRDRELAYLIKRKKIVFDPLTNTYRLPDRASRKRQ